MPALVGEFEGDFRLPPLAEKIGRAKGPLPATEGVFDLHARELCRRIAA